MSERTRGSRLAEWRQVRARRLLAALLVGAAVVVGLTALRPAAESTTPVVVAARDVPAGHRLSADDLATAHWPADSLPPQRPSRAELPGERVLGPVTAGEPLTRSRLLTSRTLRTTSPGERVIGVALADPGLAQVLRPGDRVDVLDPAGSTAARGADLLAVVPPEPESGWKGEGGGSALVAVSPDEARRVAQAASGAPGGRAPLTIAWVGDRTGR